MRHSKTYMHLTKGDLDKYGLTQTGGTLILKGD